MAILIFPNCNYKITPHSSCFSASASRRNTQNGILDGKMTKEVIQYHITRRLGSIVTIASTLLAKETILVQENAKAIDFRMVAPDQTIEQAENGIKGHAQALLEVKAFIETESWREAQKALRFSSSKLKQDIYTIIQFKPASERPLLRQLYGNLFKNVSKLDYAAREKDVTAVWQYYDKVVLALDDILTRL